MKKKEEGGGDRIECHKCECAGWVNDEHWNTEYADLGKKETGEVKAFILIDQTRFQVFPFSL